jgi:flavin reductase (DIM6/NTAB) family NADH-FMN oxidoreductase RutF
MQMRVEFLAAMRRVANSVTVVTTDGPGGRQGATVSSFCSVSADPPTLLVCLNCDSRVHDAVHSNGTFCVNVLPRGLEELSHRFAGFLDEEEPDRFSNVALKPDLEGPSIIANATAFVCKTEQAVRSGSHTVFIGHVVDIHRGVDEPLIYLDGKYREIAPLEK